MIEKNRALIWLTDLEIYDWLIPRQKLQGGRKFILLHPGTKAREEFQKKKRHRDHT